MDSINEVWEKVLEIMQQSGISQTAFDVWIKNIEPQGIRDGEIVVCVNTDFMKTTLEDNYAGKLRAAVQTALGIPLGLRIVSRENAPTASAAPVAPIQGNGYPAGNADEEYTFDNFVVGSSNKFAHAASQAVASKPAGLYNPLFIYGGSGLGKTHLLCAICKEIQKNNPQALILYTKGETMTNELIEAIKTGTTAEFHAKYRQVDILLVDDIQFISGKQSTQEEFFHTFETLHSSGKQIVLTSDRPPREIATLEERLRSRFEMGLLADIQPPDLETRMAILQYKAKQDGINITNDSIEFIATNVPSNIRELEGALNRVKYYASLVNSGVVNLALCNEVLQGLVSGNKKQALSSELIKKTVAEYYHLKATDLESKRRDQSITHPRHIAMFLCQNMLNMSLSDIGKDFGGRDHTTVLHGCKKIQSGLENDYNLEKTVNEIKEIINR